MATPDLAELMKHQERCAKLLQASAPDSAEFIAYHKLSQVFEQHQTGEPNDRFTQISLSLRAIANDIKAVPLAPPELRARTARAREIAMKFVEDVKRDVGQTRLFS
ncbi:MAG TPA: hypothetical protein VHV10_02985 [Ktedonobacteraceae bacterium]|nr:hypothetical protein [Ktedonobacteraceae bacterium]